MSAESKWTRRPPGMLTLAHRLLELQLRLTRLELAQQLRRTQAVLQALAGGVRRE